MENKKISWHYKEESKSRFVDIENKESIQNFLMAQKELATLSMFEHKELPDSIPSNYIEQILQTDGLVGIVKYENQYYAVSGYAGGVRDFNYRPTRFIASNPYLFGGSKTFKIYYGEDLYSNPMYDNSPYDGECVVILNNPYYMPLTPINEYYSQQITETVITKRLVTILSRATNVFVSPDDDDADDFKDFMDKLVKGELSAITVEDVLMKAKTMPLSEQGHKALTDLIEDYQYIKASWWNDLGLNSNYNMKRESLNSNESQLNLDSLMPFTDTMMSERKLGYERCKKLFGVKWEVDWGSSWKMLRTRNNEIIESIDESDELKDEELIGKGNDSYLSKGNDSYLSKDEEKESDDNGDTK